jgi:hypothetical protein
LHDSTLPIFFNVKSDFIAEHQPRLRSDPASLVDSFETDNCTKGQINKKCHQLGRIRLEYACLDLKHAPIAAIMTL